MKGCRETMLENLYLGIKKKASDDAKFRVKHYLNLIRNNKEYRQAMRSNKNYKDIALGKRCFILGNGPSLNNINLELLQKEDVFTVNQINRSTIFNKINPKYHCIADVDFFFLDNKDPVEAERLKYIKELQYNKNLVCIFPYDSKSFFDSIKFSNKTIFYNYFQDATKKEIKSIDMRRGIPSIRTVVQVAIYSAIYFGYKEIYLLGVENTNYYSIINKIEQTDNVEKSHVYNYTKAEREAIIRKNNSQNNESIFENFYHMFKIYDNINHYCKNNKVLIKNLTGSGILDVFEQDTLENVTKKV